MRLVRKGDADRSCAAGAPCGRTPSDRRLRPEAGERLRSCAPPHPPAMASQLACALAASLYSLLLPRSTPVCKVRHPWTRCVPPHLSSAGAGDEAPFPGGSSEMGPHEDGTVPRVVADGSASPAAALDQRKMPTASTSSTRRDEVPLLPLSSYERAAVDRKDSPSSSTPPWTPPSPSHHVSSPSRLPPRRGIVWTVLALVSLFMYGVHVAAKYGAASSTSRWTAWRSTGASASSASAHAFGSSSCGQTGAAPDDLDARFEHARRPLPERATTSERLAAWERDAPGWGVEGADWVRKSDEVRRRPSSSDPSSFLFPLFDPRSELCAPSKLN